MRRPHANRLLGYLAVTLVLGVTGVFVAAQLDLNVFVAGTPIVADDVNDNFAELATAIESSRLPDGCAAADVAEFDGVAWRCVPSRVSEMDGAEVVAAASLRWGLPDPIVVQQTYDFFEETFTTTKAGHLLLTKSLSVYLDCADDAAVRLYFLLLDDQPVLSTIQIRGSYSNGYGMSGVLTGVSAEPVAAGVHTLGVGAMCRTGSSPGIGIAFGNASSIVVLP